MRDYVQKQPPEVLYKKVFLKISQFSQKNTCITVSYLIFQLPQARNFIKKETLAEVFSCEYFEILKSIFFTGDWVAASVCGGVFIAF